MHKVKNSMTSKSCIIAIMNDTVTPMISKPTLPTRVLIQGMYELLRESGSWFTMYDPRIYINILLYATMANPTIIVNRRSPIGEKAANQYGGPQMFMWWTTISTVSCSSKRLWDTLMTNHSSPWLICQPITTPHSMPVSHIVWQLNTAIRAITFDS